MFDHFGSLWVDMKSHDKDKEENDVEDVADDMKQKAIMDWRKYEVAIMRYL